MHDLPWRSPIQVLTVVDMTELRWTSHLASIGRHRAPLATIESLFSLSVALCEELFNSLHSNNTPFLNHWRSDSHRRRSHGVDILRTEEYTNASPMKHPALDRCEGIVIDKTTSSSIQVQSRRISTTEIRLPTIGARSCCHLAAIYFRRSCFIDALNRLSIWRRVNGSYG